MQVRDHRCHKLAPCTRQPPQGVVIWCRGQSSHSKLKCWRRWKRRRKKEKRIRLLRPSFPSTNALWRRRGCLPAGWCCSMLLQHAHLLFLLWGQNRRTAASTANVSILIRYVCFQGRFNFTKYSTLIMSKLKLRIRSDPVEMKYSDTSWQFSLDTSLLYLVVWLLEQTLYWQIALLICPWFNWELKLYFLAVEFLDFLSSSVFRFNLGCLYSIKTNIRAVNSKPTKGKLVKTSQF